MQILELESQAEIRTRILGELKAAAKSDARFNPTVITGSCGAGKSTLLRSIYDRLTHDGDLQAKYNPVIVPFLFDGKRLEASLEQLLVASSLSDATKQHIIIIDDLDLILHEAEDQAHVLRGLMLRSQPIVSMIAAASPAFGVDELARPDRALYGFLRVLRIPELTDLDITRLLHHSSAEPVWKSLNDQLSLTTPFWMLTLTDGNPRLLTALANLMASEANGKVIPDELVRRYFEFTGPFFLSQIMNVPKNNRYLLEAASLLGRSFGLKELDLADLNLSQEARRLVSRGLLVVVDKGHYSFRSTALKAWLRYIKNLPLGQVLSVDLNVARTVR